MPHDKTTVTIRSVRYMGSAPARRIGNSELIGQDGGQSISLGNRTLFVYADTLLAKVSGITQLTRSPRRLSADAVRFRANCAAVSHASSFETAIGDHDYFLDAEGCPREILTTTMLERMEGYRFWPQHGLFVDGKVYLYYIGIQQVDQTSTWGFQPVGSGLAVLDPVSGDCERLQNGSDWCFWPLRDKDFHVGVQVLHEGQTAYVFFSRRRGHACYAGLARVPVNRIADLTAYEYLASPEPTWTPDIEHCYEHAACSPEYSVSFNPYLQRYLMVYVDGYAKELLLRTAPRVWGPYSDAQVAGTLPYQEGVEVISLGFEHPGFTRDNGQTVFISYCQPHFAQNSLVALTFA